MLNKNVIMFPKAGVVGNKAAYIVQFTLQKDEVLFDVYGMKTDSAAEKERIARMLEGAARKLRGD